MRREISVSRRYVLAFGAALALLWMVSSAAWAEPLTVTDLADRSVKIDLPVKRIVCAGPGALRLFVYMSQSDKVVGVEEMEKDPTGRPYAYAHPEFKKLPTIGPGGPAYIDRGPDPEATLACKPDALFVTYMQGQNAEKLQNKLGIPVVVLSYGDLGTFDEIIFDSFRLIGQIMEFDERANALIDFFTQMKKELSGRAAPLRRPQLKIYVGGIGHRGAHGIDSTLKFYPPFEFLGIKSVVEGLEGDHIFIDREKLLEWDPDVIFIDGGGNHLVQADAKENPHFYEHLSAFKHRRVYLTLPFNYYATNLGTCFANAYYVGTVLYPEAFKDIKQESKADDIYAFLLGKGVYDEMGRDFGGYGPWTPLH
jgi:iron complex transport system substrate-binding protein